MIVENINYLRRYYPTILDKVKVIDKVQSEQMVEVINTKFGLPTIQVRIDNRLQYIHSKYDPIAEAERIVSQYNEHIEEYKHIIFYGVGMGYHVEMLTNRYPNKSFTLYEPKPDIYKHYLSHRKISDLPTKKLEDIGIEWSKEYCYQFINNFAIRVDGDVLLVVLPSYERLFPKEFEFFQSILKEKLQQKKISFGAEAQFSKRWTLNALMNLPFTLQCPNIVVDKKEYFKGKPVVLVSAGPSLEDELENLKVIKNNKLAYIFSVGSANKTLIANGILPDAVCTYDPQGGNGGVFKELIDSGHDLDVPMIYGTTVGFETLEQYKGPKLHVLTSQDTVSQYFIHNSKKAVPFVEDSFSIAIVTLQILSMLEVGQVILVGQNFAFRNNKFYSAGISYGEVRTTEVQDKDLIDKIFVQDVNGNQVLTNQSFNQMRLLMEYYIEVYKNIKVINTTKDGAAIKGTIFISLDEIIRRYLNSTVVEQSWFSDNEVEDKKIDERIKQFKKEMFSFKKVINSFEKTIKLIVNNIKNRNFNKVFLLYKEFDQDYQGLLNSKVYQMIIRPVLRVETELFEKKLRITLEDEKDDKLQAERITEVTFQYLALCKKYIEDYNVLLEKKVYPRIQNNDTKYYSALQNRSIFKMTGTWNDNNSLLMKNTKDLSHFQLDSLTGKKKGASLEFKFFGDYIRVIAATRKDFASKVSIEIDGKRGQFTTRDLQLLESETPNHHEVVFEKDGLENKLHHVKMELLQDKCFTLEGIEISLDGRLLHVDEVDRIEDLVFGKKIRCHYTANFDELGNFSNLGEETANFIPSESSALPNGDFYLIMVDNDSKDRKFLVADRNVQHSISWKTINESFEAKKNVVTIDNCHGNIRLLSGGKAFRDNLSQQTDKYLGYGAWPLDNDWDIYINKLINQNIIRDKKDFHCDGIASWCSDETSVGVVDTIYNKQTLKGKRYRTGRGAYNLLYLNFNEPHLVIQTWGFRPLMII